MRAAKKTLLALRAQRAAAISMQRVARGKAERLRFRLIKEQDRRRRAATKIAALIRGHIARTLYFCMQQEWHLENVEHPCASMIQAAWKGLQARRWFKVLVNQDKAVLVLQKMWRNELRRRQSRAVVQQLLTDTKNRLATALQASFRGFLGRKRFVNAKRERDARRLWATRRLQLYVRAWLLERRKAQEKQDRQREVLFLDLELVLLEMDEVKDDIEDVKQERVQKVQYLKTSEKTRKDLKKGIKAYQRINELGLKLLRPGGVLVSGSCSMHLARADLLAAMQGAARRSGCELRVLEQSGQGPDHPVHPLIPETEYLKSIFARRLSPAGI
jgi:hypothetical protein